MTLIILGAGAWWVWSAQGAWSPLDLQTAEWSEGFGLTHVKSIDVLLLYLMAAAFALVVWRSRRVRQLASRPESIPRLAATFSFAVVAVTVAVLVHDAAISPWSPARQSLEAAVGRNGCGLAHQLQGRDGLVEELSDPDVRTLLSPPVALYLPCATIPSVRGGLVDIPKFVVSDHRWLLRETDGPFAAISDLYDARRIALGPRGVEVLSVADRIPGFVRVNAMRRTESN